MIKKFLIAAITLMALAIPAFAADNDNADNQNPNYCCEQEYYCCGGYQNDDNYCCGNYQRR